MVPILLLYLNVLEIDWDMENPIKIFRTQENISICLKNKFVSTKMEKYPKIQKEC